MVYSVYYDGFFMVIRMNNPVRVLYRCNSTKPRRDGIARVLGVTK